RRGERDRAVEARRAEAAGQGGDGARRAGRLRQPGTGVPPGGGADHRLAEQPAHPECGRGGAPALRRGRAGVGEDAGGVGGGGPMSASVAELDLETGTWTRAAFEQQVASAVHVARRAAQPCSVLVVDVDDFQAVRDVRGDLAADTCIEALAERISAESHGAGPIGRLAEDTFALLLPGWALPRACALADRLRGASRTAPAAGAPVSGGV